MGISPAVLRSAFISLEMSARPGLQIQSALPGSIEVFFLFFFSFSLTPYMPLADIIWPVVVEIPVCAPCLCSFFFFFLQQRPYVAAPRREGSRVKFSSLS